MTSATASRIFRHSSRRVVRRLPAGAQRYTTLSGALADRYRIERVLGEGGMATVYLAHDLKHDRKVALKVLKPELGAVLGAERFLSEIKVTAQLQHPNLLPLFDSAAGAGADELQPSVSPDGHCLAFTSNETGGTEVFVLNIENPSTRLQITTEGGVEPVWRDNHSLVVRSGASLVAISLGFAPRIEALTYSKGSMLALPSNRHFRDHDR